MRGLYHTGVWNCFGRGMLILFYIFIFNEKLLASINCAFVSCLRAKEGGGKNVGVINEPQFFLQTCTFKAYTVLYNVDHIVYLLFCKCGAVHRNTYSVCAHELDDERRWHHFRGLGDSKLKSGSAVNADFGRVDADS